MLQLLSIGSSTSPTGPALFFRNISEHIGVNITIETVLIVFVILLTINAFIQYWKSILDARYQQSFIYSLRRRLFRKVIMADWPLLNSRSRTNHLQVLTKEVPNLANYLYFLLRLITEMIFTISYLIYAFAVSAEFTLLITAAGVVIFITLQRSLSRSFVLGEGYVSSYNRLLKYIDDFWQTVKIAKVHSSEDFYFNKFNEANASILDLEYRMQKNYSLPQLIYRIAGLIVLVVVVYAGYRTGSTPLTSLFILILLFSRIYPQFVSMNTDLNMIAANTASVRLVLNLDNELAEDDLNRSDKHESIGLEKEIRLAGIGFGYPGEEAIFNDYIETIPARTLTGILGIPESAKPL